MSLFVQRHNYLQLYSNNPPNLLGRTMSSGLKMRWDSRTLTPIIINLKCEPDVLIHILLDEQADSPPNGILPKSDFGIETLVVPPGFGPGLRVSKTPVQPLHHGTFWNWRWCWVRTNSLVGLWGIFSTHECKARAYSQLGQNLTFQPQSKLANPRVTWLPAWRLSRPPCNFCDTTCSSLPWNMPFVLLCLNYPPLKGSAGSLLHWTLRRANNNQTWLAGFRFSSGMPYSIAIHGYRLHCSLGLMFPQLSPTRSWDLHMASVISHNWLQSTHRDSNHGLPLDRGILPFWTICA